MLAERTLFLPSVGAVLVVGALVVVLADLTRARWGESRAVRVAAVSACVALLATGAYRSATRTTVWKNNDVVFHHAVLDAPYDYRAHYMLGAVEFEAGNRRAGEAEYRKALRLFPYDPGMSFGLAEQYRVVGMCEPALPLYKWTLGLDPGFPVGRTQYATCLLKEHDFTEAKHWAIEAVKVGGNLASLHHLIVAIDSVKKADQARACRVGAESRRLLAKCQTQCKRRHRKSRYRLTPTSSKHCTRGGYGRTATAVRTLLSVPASVPPCAPLSNSLFWKTSHA